MKKKQSSQETIMKNEYILGIDIGGTNFRIGLVNNKYEIIDFNMKSISELK